MSKGNLFVVIYSIVLIALFVTFCYLMTIVNPLSKSDPDSTLKFGSDDLLFRNDALLTKDIVRYGLERVSEEFENVDQDHNLHGTLATHSEFMSKMTKNVKYVVNTDMPQYLTNKEFSANCTNREVKFLNIVTPSIKPVKDLRRSINDENQKKFHEEAPRSLLLKIKNIEGEPRIEIEVMSEKLKNKRTRKYRSSGAKFITSLNSFEKLNNISDQNTREAFIQMDAKETLILNIFANSIDIINEDENETIDPQLLKKSTTNDSDSFQIINTPKSTISKEYFDTQTSVSDLHNTVIDQIFQNRSTTMYMFNLLSTIKDSKSLNVRNEPEDPIRSEDDGKQNKSSSTNSLSLQNFTNTQFQIYNGSHSIKNLMLSTAKFKEVSIGQNVTMTGVNVDIYTGASSSSLMGLLIPEATATVPANYHFIN